MGTAPGDMACVPRGRDSPGHGRTWGRVLPTAAGLASVTWITSGCAADAPSMFKPAGPGAARVEGLAWLLFGLSAAVFCFVTALLILSVVRRRRARGPVDERGHEAAEWGDRFILVAGVLVPAVILTGTFVVGLREMRALAKPLNHTRMTISVIGHLWWWEARYPNGAVTANEIHIPVGVPVRVELTTADVIHTFWVPQLQTKTDQIPGHTNEMWIQADAAGRYRGQCSQFCGLQHAHMIFYVVADPPAEFESWVSGQASPAKAPDSPAAARGLQVFTSTTCAGCHTIRGTPAQATVGPDLTHLASRATIASGTISDTTADLEAWITDPQSIKPGAIMPPTQLSPSDLQALVAYLQSLS